MRLKGLGSALLGHMVHRTHGGPYYGTVGQCPRYPHIAQSRLGTPIPAHTRPPNYITDIRGATYATVLKALAEKLGKTLPVDEGIEVESAEKYRETLRTRLQFTETQ